MIFRIPGFTGFSLSDFGMTFDSISSNSTGSTTVMAQFSGQEISSFTSSYSKLTQVDFGVVCSSLRRGTDFGLRTDVFDISARIVPNGNIHLDISGEPVGEDDRLDSSNILMSINRTALIPAVE